jgi:glycosyltransferase involved in cell wall biosynthesis
MITWLISKLIKITKYVAKMKINIAASHRFHLLDLARELSNQGHEVRFYSYVPTSRAIKFGLKKECSYSLLIFILPFLALIKLTRSSFFSIKLKNLALDYYLSWFMKPCDIYIALGTVYKKSFISAKKKFGATTILEWGSKHIEEQQRILSNIPGVKRQSEYFTERSLQGYEIADYIAIASNHVKVSFVERGVDERKLLQNPYGVDLSMFSPTMIKGKIYDLIMVGGWCYRKGCDLLVDVCRKNNFTLLHVGSLVDLDFPQDINMTHVDSVDQCLLINYYSQARVFVLPSREEGLAMVQAQALVCGLPIVCSMHTGGRDLREFLEDKKWILEMREYSFEELERCIVQALELAKNQTGLRSYSDNVIDQLTWSAYGSRYNNNLKYMNTRPQTDSGVKK